MSNVYFINDNEKAFNIESPGPGTKAKNSMLSFRVVPDTDLAGNIWPVEIYPEEVVNVNNKQIK